MVRRKNIPFLDMIGLSLNRHGRDVLLGLYVHVGAPQLSALLADCLAIRRADLGFANRGFLTDICCIDFKR